MGVGRADSEARTSATSRRAGRRGFAHTAFLYDGDDEYVTGTCAFLQEGLDAGEPAVVSVPRNRIRQLGSVLGAGARSSVRFTPMEDLGRNPAWIIPAWADFIGPHLAAGRRVRGVGEPVWAERTPDELVECQRHEALVNLALANADGFSLLCPYDVGALGADVIAHACRDHPTLGFGGAPRNNAAYATDIPSQLDDPLRAAPPWAESVAFGRDDAWSLRRRVALAAADAGFDAEGIEDLTVAISEALTNTVEHGGGSGRMVWWTEGDRFVCDIRDHGRIDDPLVGRIRPDPARGSGRGMWLIHQLCDLVQIRQLIDGTTVVRLHRGI